MPTTITAAYALNDIIEALCHEFILQPEQREKVWPEIEFFMKSLDNGRDVFGRCWATLLITCCCETLGVKKMEIFNYDEWETVVQNLNAAKNLILRNDATLLIPPRIDDKDVSQSKVEGLQDEAVNKSRSSLSIFNDEFADVVKLCRLHQALSFVRVPLVEDPTKVNLNVSKNDMVKMKKTIDKKFSKDMDEYKFLNSVFDKNKLKSTSQVNKILNSRDEYSIEYFVDLMDELMKNWLRIVMPETPILISSGYFRGPSKQVPLSNSSRKRAKTDRTTEHMSANAKAYSDSKKPAKKTSTEYKHEPLDFEHGEDDDEHKRTIQHVDVGSMVVGVDSADDEDSSNEVANGESQTLHSPSSPPKATMVAIARPKKGLSPNTPKKRTRVMWTVEEKNAVRRGVSKFGEGNWINIKLHYPTILAHRSNVQIKDCWRVMVKKGDTALEIGIPTGAV